MSKFSPDDRLLVEAFGMRRQESAFRELYRRHTPMLFALAVRLSGSRNEAEELTQEAWVRAVEQHDRFDSRSKYSTWVTGILINCAREARRRNARTPLATKTQSDAAESVKAFPGSAPFRAHPIDLERALARLPDGFREVVILHDVNGYTHREIGEMLSIEPGTSKSQLARGRTRLRQLLASDSESNIDQRGTS